MGAYPYPFPLSDFLPEPVAPQLPPQSVPETIVAICPSCEEGGVLVGQGEAYEHYETCPTCLGDWQQTHYLCEISDPPHYVSEHEMTMDGICLGCHKKGKEHLECEQAKYATNEAEELAWAVSIGWLTLEEVVS